MKKIFTIGSVSRKKDVTKRELLKTINNILLEQKCLTYHQFEMIMERFNDIIYKYVINDGLENDLTEEYLVMLNDFTWFRIRVEDEKLRPCSSISYRKDEG